MSSTAAMSPEPRGVRPRVGQAGWIWVFLLALGGAGCSLLVDVNRDQCRIDSDCGKRGLAGTCIRGVCVTQGSCERGDGCAVEPPSTCSAEALCELGADQTCWQNQCLPTRDLSSFLCNRAEPQRADKVVVTVHVEQIGSNMPPPGLVVSACRSADVACSQPEDMARDTLGTGAVMLLVPWRFLGYIEARSDTTMPQLFYFTRAIVEPTTLQPLRLLTPDFYQRSLREAGAPNDSDHGLVLLETLDCAGNFVPGLQYEASQPDGFPFYIVNGTPRVDIDMNSPDPTINGALRGFANIRSGSVQFWVYVGASGPLLDEVNVNVRAATVTQVEIRPSPG